MAPRGFWDDDVNPAGVRLAPQIGPAELAARLGSIVTFDRLGEVIFLDGFEHGTAHWELDPSGVGSVAALTAASSKTGSYALELTSGITGQQDALARRSFPFERAGRFGLEASFTLDPTGALTPPNAQVIVHRHTIWDGTTLYQAWLRLTLVTGQLAILTTGGVYTNIGDAAPLWAGSYVFNTLKLVIDLTTGLYHRVHLNGLTLTPTTIPINAVANTSTPAMRPQFGVQGDGDATHTTYWDSIILTQNEP